MTADENWPEEEEVKMIASGMWKPPKLQAEIDVFPDPHLKPWVARNTSRERVYEAAKVVEGVKRYYTQSPLGQQGWSGTGYSKCRWGVATHVTGRLEEFFGDTLAEALERMGQAMEADLTRSDNARQAEQELLKQEK